MTRGVGEAATPRLEVRGLSVRFGGFRALSDVSWAVRGGQILGIIGPNGAGKSTCFNATTNMVRHDGQVLLDGDDVTALPPHRLAAQGLHRTFQQNAFFSGIPVLENMTGALLRSTGTPLAASVPGEVEFERDGRRYRLHPVTQPNDPKLFFIFSDRTSGKESYGGARYLFVDAPENGDIVLDFNRAENPPCALTPHLVCPIAPPGNRLDLAISAGEKTYVSRW